MTAIHVEARVKGESHECETLEHDAVAVHKTVLEKLTLVKPLVVVIHRDQLGQQSLDAQRLLINGKLNHQSVLATFSLLLL